MWLLVLALLTQAPAPSAGPATSAPAATATAPTTSSSPAAATVVASPPTGTVREAVVEVKGWYERFMDYLPRLYEKLIDYVPHLGSALFILLVGWWLAGWIKRMLQRLLTARHVEITLASFLSQLCYWLIITVVVLVAMQNAQMETTPFSAVLGAGALAVGLALQNSLSNFAAGVIIILFRHFRVGDEIETGSVKGLVEEISIFNTNLRTGDNRVIIIPNGSILNSPLTNNSAKFTRRLDLVFNISYGSDLRRARQVILEVLKADQRVLPEPAPDVIVTNLGESSVDLTMRAWVNTSHYANVRAAMLEAVKLRFDETGIDIPFPQHEVHVRQVP